MGFAAPALQLADRDHWIGWTVDQRRDSLHMVVNMSRFLIRANVRCANLASRVLAMAALRLPAVSHAEFCGQRPFCGHQLSGRQLDTDWPDAGLRQTGSLPQSR